MRYVASGAPSGRRGPRSLGRSPREPRSSPRSRSGPLLAGGPLRLRLEQQGDVALEHDGQRRGDVDIGHVVLAHVVGDHVAEEREPFGRRQRLGDRVVEAGQPSDVHVLDRGQLHLGEGLARRLLDRPQQVALARGDEGDRVAAAPGTAGAAGAVHVGLGVGRDVVVDDVADPVDVEAAGRHVGRDQDVELAVAKLADGPLALGLHDVAVDGGRREPPGAQLLGQRLGLVLGADEDDHPLEVLHLEDAREGVDLLRVGHHQVAVRDVGSRRRLVLDGDLDGIAEVLLRDPPDLGRHGGREQRDVLVGGRVGQDRLDVVGEAHVQHLVGLVEDQEPQLGQVESALLQVVHDPAGRADDDVHASAQGAELHAVRLAAVDRQHVHARHVGGVPLERLAHLERQLARRREDQRLRLLLPQVEPRQDRQRERRRLAGARLGQADDVATGEQGGDRLGLDGRRGLVADLLDGLEHAGIEAQVGEGEGVRVRLGVVGHRTTVGARGG